MSAVKFLRRIASGLEQWKLLRRTTCRVPTLRALGLLLGLLLAGAIGTARLVYPFLAVIDPVSSDLLVIEGWVPQHTLRLALAEFRRGQYREICVTGGPLEKGEPLSEYGTYAELGCATLQRMGAPAAVLRAVPAPLVKRDRTLTSAAALRDWARGQGRSLESLNVVTTGAHARRTRLMFERALGPGVQVGVIGVPDDRYDASRWWRSSEGFRSVSYEVIGYLYARLLFPFSDERVEP